MPPLELVLLGLGALIMILALPRLARAMRRRTDEARASLASLGYVIEPSQYKPIGQMTRLWGNFDEPTAFYLQISNLDPVQNLAGLAGIADLRVGDPSFDDTFVVRSSHPEQARRTLDEHTRSLLIAQGKLRFRTGSIDSLLGADFFPENRSQRNLRAYWMIEVSGKPEEVDKAALLALSRRLAAGVTTVPNQGPAVPAPILWTQDKG